MPKCCILNHKIALRTVYGCITDVVCMHFVIGNARSFGRCSWIGSNRQWNQCFPQISLSHNLVDLFNVWVGSNKFY